MAPKKKRRPGQGAPQRASEPDSNVTKAHHTASAPGPEVLLVGPKEAARLLSISERLLWSRSRGPDPIPSVRLNRRILYRISDLKRWVDGLGGRRS